MLKNHLLPQLGTCPSRLPDSLGQTNRGAPSHAPAMGSWNYRDAAKDPSVECPKVKAIPLPVSSYRNRGRDGVRPLWRDALRRVRLARRMHPEKWTRGMNQATPRMRVTISRFQESPIPFRRFVARMARADRPSEKSGPNPTWGTIAKVAHDPVPYGFTFFRPFGTGSSVGRRRASVAVWPSWCAPLEERPKRCLNPCNKALRRP